MIAIYASYLRDAPLAIVILLAKASLLLITNRFDRHIFLFRKTRGYAFLSHHFFIGGANNQFVQRTVEKEIPKP